MEVIRFFCVILAYSLLLARTSVAQGSNDTTTTTELTTQSTPTTAKTETTPTPTSPETTATTQTSHSTSLSTESSTKTSEAKPTENSTSASPTTANSTTAAPTTEPPTTQVPSTPSAPPKFTWSIHDENKTACLLVQLEMSFKNPNGSEETGTFKLPTNASVDHEKSTCGKNSSQVLVLTYFDKSVELKFDKVEETDKAIKFYLSSLTFTNGSATYTLNGTNEDFMAGHLNKSFKCDNEETHTMTGDESVTWKDVKVQAFMTQEAKGNFDAEEVCSQDGTSDVVPIAVGCALAGLVVVVLIAYLVGRRRSRQKGYQSV